MVKDSLSGKYGAFLRRNWLWVAIGGAGLATHLATAALRLGTFFPTPRLLDFAGFYASAWAVRQGLSPYNLPAEWLQGLQAAQSIPVTPAPIYHPPFWPWLLQPLTWFSYPTAALIWLALNIAWLIAVTAALGAISGSRRSSRVPLFFLVLTFGPVFLNLTLGQMSILLLVAVLAIGRSLSRYPLDSAAGPSRLAANRIPAGRPQSAYPLLVAAAGAFAVGVKLFPLLWVGALALLRRWRELMLTAVLIVAIVVLGLWVSLSSSREYVGFLRAEGLARWSAGSNVDDQALLTWLDRLVRPQTFAVSGVGVDERTTVVWTPPWTVDAAVVRRAGYILLVLLLLPCLYVSLRATRAQQEAVIYLWALYGLLAFLHIERYNHVLLLPAMAWLWGWGQSPQGTPGRAPWQRKVVVVAYALVGLSRLTHLWAMLLPAPWGPLASGFGLYAVLLLGAALVVNLWPSRWVNLAGTKPSVQ